MIDRVGTSLAAPSRGRGPGRRHLLHAFLAALVLGAPAVSRAQAPALLDTTIAAGEADAQAPVQRGLAKYNHWDLGFTTFRVGYGFLVDFATYYQDHDAKQQVVPRADIGLRDFRFLLKGKFKTQRPFSW